MAEAFEVEVNGEVYEVQADTPQQAATYARLLAAREQGVSQAEAGAVERSNARQGNLAFMPGQRGAPTSVPVSGEEGLAELESGKQLGATTAGMAGMAALSAPAAAAAPLSTALGVGKDMAIGWGIGQAGEMLGLPPWASEAAAGALGLRGLYKAGAKGLLGKILTREGAEAAGGKAAATVAKEAPGVAAKRAEMELAKRAAELKDLETRTANRLAKEARDAERHELQKEVLKARLEGRIPARPPRTPRAPKPENVPVPSKTAAVAEAEMLPDEAVAEILPDEAVAAVVDPIPEPTILPKGQRAMATNLGGKAAPGPAPTPEVDLEDVLRRSIEAAKAKKAAAAASSPLRGPRLERGAERVGKEVGLTKGEVRVATGPRLNEKIGEASPVLPDQPFDKIYDKMIGMKPEERVAYVARARGVKTAGQVETIRRTLARAGLLVPVLPSLGEFLAND